MLIGKGIGVTYPKRKTCGLSESIFFKKNEKNSKESKFSQVYIFLQGQKALINLQGQVAEIFDD